MHDEFAISERRSWFSRFLRYWFQFAMSDATTAAFGWAAIPSGALLLGAMRYWGIQMSPSPQLSEVLLYALAGAGAAWFIAFSVHLVVLAPIKAYRAVEPFVTSIDDVIRSPEFIANNEMHGYTASVVIRNRSSTHLLDCHVYILDIEGTNPVHYPRFVDKFDLLPHEEKHVAIAYWFSREAPNTDDTTIGISGPVAPCFGGNVVRIPISDYRVSIKVQAGDSRSKEIQCRLWVDTPRRRLRAECL